MKLNVAAAVAGGLIIGAASMVPLGSMASTGIPAANATVPAADEPMPENTEPAIDPAVTPPNPVTPITPPSFGAGAGGVDDDDDDVEYEDDDDDDHHDDDDHEDESDDD